MAFVVARNTIGCRALACMENDRGKKFLALIIGGVAMLFIAFTIAVQVELSKPVGSIHKGSAGVHDSFR